MKPSLFYPVKPANINQAFGLNANSFYAQDGMKGHNGIDYQAYHGQAVYASHDGTCEPMIDDHGGNGVVVRADTYATIYWHLIQDDAVVQNGDVVKAGDLLGYADSTGQSTGDHLHFGFRFWTTPMDNGYRGYEDPQPYLNGKYAQDINNPPPIPPPFQFTKVLRLKAWNNDVKQLQTVLTKLNLYTGKIDGIFGPITLTSVKQFQTTHGLVADGIVGPKTNAVLNSLL